MGAAKRRGGTPEERQAQSGRATIATDYGAVRNAYNTLVGLAGRQIVDGNGPLSLTLPFGVILKMKRIIGALRPLTGQMHELLGELQTKHGYDAKERAFPTLEAQEAFGADMEAALATEVEVECERLTGMDFADVGNASVVMVGVLDSLGPFWQD